VPQKVKNKIIEENVLEVGKSERSIGRKWGIDGKTVKKIMIEAGVNKTKRRKAPKSSEEQKVRQKKRLIKVSKSFFMPLKGLEIIMDDESYFSIDGSDSFGNDFYYSHESLEAPNNVKYKFVSKFP